jgi:crotonobetainyl-CoA:carnitine CoA-transferase CaiB-like acyl-CoA transferase
MGSDDRPLDGVRVIDLTTSFAGPVASMYLADMGAEVIKVERPVNGDDSRSWGPPFVGGESAWFLAANRNKRSVCIDIRDERGFEALMRMLASADVFIQSFNPTKLGPLGLEPERLRKRFPRLIYCSLSGFGLEGPDRNLPGYDLVAQARSGLMSVTGEEGRMPQRVSTALSDISAGTVASFTIAAALRRAALTGEGDSIDVTLFDAALALMAPRIASYLAGEPEPRPSGATDSVLSVYQAFETADRPIVIAVGNDTIWQRTCEVLSLPALAADPTLASNSDRRERREQVIAAFQARLLEKSSEEWLAAFTVAAVPAAPIRFLSDTVTDPQLIARGSIDVMTHPDAGQVQVVGAPWRLASEGGRGRMEPAPRLGSDTCEVLRETGYTDPEIDELISEGVAWPTRVPTS